MTCSRGSSSAGARARGPAMLGQGRGCLSGGPGWTVIERGAGRVQLLDFLA